MQEYLSILDDLFACFGRSISEKQAYIWVKAIQEKHTPIILKQAVDKLSVESKRLPTLSDILEVCQAIKPAENAVYYDCHKCKGSGLVSIEKKYRAGEDKYYYATYAYRCDCKNGERYPNFKPAPDYVMQDGKMKASGIEVLETNKVNEMIDTLATNKKIGGLDAKF